MIDNLENRQEQADRLTWHPGDVSLHRNLEDLKRDLRSQGKIFIPSRSEDPGNEKETE